MKLNYFMSSRNLFNSVVALFLIAGQAEYAGASSYYNSNGSSVEVTEAQLIQGAKFGTRLLNSLNEINQSFKKSNGQDLKVVLLARTGVETQKVAILKDYDDSGNGIDLQKMSRSDLPPYFAEEGLNREIRTRLSRLEDKNPARTLEFDHMAFAVRHRDANGLLGWDVYRVVVNNEDPKNETEPLIVRSGLGWFFTSPADEVRAQVTVLPLEIQEQVLSIILDKKAASSLLASKLRAAASFTNSLASDAQNVNSWPLEVLAMALSERENVSRKNAISYLKETGYLQTKVLLTYKDSAKLALAATSLINLYFPEYLRVSPKDQPYLAHGLLELTTVLSVNEYLDRQLGNSIQRYEF